MQLEVAAIRETSPSIGPSGLAFSIFCSLLLLGWALTSGARTRCFRGGVLRLITLCAWQVRRIRLLLVLLHASCARKILMLLVLAHTAAAACPDASWAESEFGCHRVTQEMSSHWGCMDLCGPNASLACIGSAAENVVVTGLVSATLGYNENVWIGLYQRADGQEPDGGWDVCASGEAAGYANWATYQPNNGGDSWTPPGPQNCSALWSGEDWGGGVSSGVGRWRDGPCYYSRIRCLCEHGAAASPEYSTFAKVQEAEAAVRLRAHEAHLQAWTLATFLGIIPFLSLLPLLLVRCYSGARRLCGRTATPVSPTSEEAPEADGACDPSLPCSLPRHPPARTLSLTLQSSLSPHPHPCVLGLTLPSRTLQQAMAGS